MTERKMTEEEYQQNIKLLKYFKFNDFTIYFLRFVPVPVT